ncbi:MAG: putative DNA-binding domain-containing protein [Acidobacteria bacterium]|nr:putative DNA-binding domain-containing protein [Acidobacteriota bacterium]
MRFTQVQRQMAAALMQRLGPGDRLARRSATGHDVDVAAIIKPNSLLSARERLEIYSRAYWFRLLDAIRDDFPGLAAVLGQRAFEGLARAYLADCPSRSYTLRDLGSRLARWLAAHPEYGARNPRLAIDMARLEWAHIVAFDGPAGKVLDPEHLLELKPGLRLGLQPYISLLELQYPVDEMRVAINTSGHAPRRVVDQTRIHLAVHRAGLSVYYRRLTLPESRLLRSLRAGWPVEEAIGRCFRDSSGESEEMLAKLRAWFAAWSEFGWLTVREANGERSRP